MGYSVLIDILGSMIIGGLFLLTLLRFNENTTQNTYAFNGEVIVQENLTATVESLEYDLRKIGYCENPSEMPLPFKAILYADSSEIKYLSDTQLNGTLDTVRYFLGPAAELSGTTNPHDRFLYRSVNGAARSVNLGVTEFKIKYFGSLGQVLTPPLSVPTGIAFMQIDLKVEDVEAYNNDYRTAFYRQIRVASRNL